MIWRLEGEGRTGWLVGTAHFFPVRFTSSLTRLFDRVEAVAMEGPLDEESMRRIADHGRNGDGTPDLVDLLEPAAVATLDRRLEAVLGDDVRDHPILALFSRNRPGAFERYTRGMRPWMAYFSVWTACLGWEHSVDREGYELALARGLPVTHIETLEEQLEVLDGIPLRRLVRQLNDVERWPEYTETYARRFLAGDLDGLLELAQTFHMRRRPRMSERDGRQFERILELFRTKTAAAFVGFPHVPGVARLFEERGWRVTQEAP
jgi:hypothetical protein